jgi:hypothetical protein
MPQYMWPPPSTGPGWRAFRDLPPWKAGGTTDAGGVRRLRSLEKTKVVKEILYAED